MTAAEIKALEAAKKNPLFVGTETKKLIPQKTLVPAWAVRRDKQDVGRGAVKCDGIKRHLRKDQTDVPMLFVEHEHLPDAVGATPEIWLGLGMMRQDQDTLVLYMTSEYAVITEGVMKPA